MKVAVTASLITKAKEYGITISDIASLANKSAKHTSLLGNRRYKEWVFNEVEGVVINFERLNTFATNCKVCGDDGYLILYDLCEKCFGAGCSHCNSGYIRKQRKCPNCKKPFDKKSIRSRI